MSVPDFSATQLKALGAQTLSEWDASPAPSTTAAIGAATSTHTRSLPQGCPAPGPVPLGGPRSTEHVQKLNHLCQARGIKPEFDFIKYGDRWAANLTLEGNLIEAEGAFSSKMEGKEVCAEKGCELLKILPLCAVGRTNGSENIGANPAIEEDEVGIKRSRPREENWIGLLLEHSHATTNHTQPIYHDFLHPAHNRHLQAFSCTVQLPSFPSAPTFGSVPQPHGSKKAAKAAAARDAVVWLRDNGHMGGDGQAPTRKQVRMTSSSGDGAALGLAAEAGDEAGGEVSYAQQVNNLREVLGLSGLTYRLQARDGTSLYSGAAYFEGKPAVRGAVGEVRDVFGRKNAKEECAKGVLRVLMGMMEERVRGMPAAPL